MPVPREHVIHRGMKRRLAIRQHSVHIKNHAAQRTGRNHGLHGFRGWIRGVDESFVLEAGGTKVEQKRPRETGAFEVVDYLRTFNVRYLSDGFQLYNDIREANEVRAV